MTDQIPYADYVRIEIHAGGKAQIVELHPDEYTKVKANLAFVTTSEDRISIPTSHVQRFSTNPHLVLDVSSAIATFTTVTPEPELENPGEAAR